MFGKQYQRIWIQSAKGSASWVRRGRRSALAVVTLAVAFAGLATRPSRAQQPSPAAPPAAQSAPADASLPVREFTVEELTARAIARTQLGLPGGMVVATWSELAKRNGKSRYGTRYLWDRQKTFDDYPGFLKRFSHTGTEPDVVQGRVLLLSVHAAHGLGFQVASPDINALQIPAEINFDQLISPLEFVSLGRVRADLGDKYALIILGQCQPRACLRFQDGDIPVGKELYKQILRLSGSERQLSIVRNRRENIYLIGTEVVYREPYSPPAGSGELAKVVSPDLIGGQVVNRDALRSSMTDVWILSGHWTDQPVQRDSDKINRATPEMVAVAEQRVREALDAERKEALARGITLPEPALAPAAPTRRSKSGG